MGHTGLAGVPGLEVALKVISVFTHFWGWGCSAHHAQPISRFNNNGACGGLQFQTVLGLVWHVRKRYHQHHHSLGILHCCQKTRVNT